jgi:hypothetical protein
MVAQISQTIKLEVCSKEIYLLVFDGWEASETDRFFVTIPVINTSEFARRRKRERDDDYTVYKIVDAFTRMRDKVYTNI